MQRGERELSVVEQREQVGGLYVCVRSCAQVPYIKIFIQVVRMSVHVCVCVRACECICLRAPRGAQVQRREICNAGRVDVTNAWCLDTCKVSVSPVGHREEQQRLSDW